ncbi:MAG: hypothetical protein ACP6IY_20305 [Promethearchaeia archaeon]
MDKQRILKEAQKIAAKFSFWMVSGNIAHLFGYAYETPEKKYELEIKFDDDFPETPPKLIYHDEIKELLGDFVPEKLKNWTPDSSVVDIVHELKAKIQQSLNEPISLEKQQLIPIIEPQHAAVNVQQPQKIDQETQENNQEEYITPDLNAYPPDFDYNQYITPKSENFFDNQFQEDNLIQTDKYRDSTSYSPEEIFIESEPLSLDISTELGLIQQEYAYDQRSSNKADINVYLTITLTKTFIIPIDFSNYPEKPKIQFPQEIIQLIGDPYKTLETLAKWKPKKAPHIVDILHELEKRLFFIKDIEIEVKKILGEYQCDLIENNITQLNVHLLTYGFKEYLLNINLGSYPKPPKINLTPELEQIIKVPITELNSYKNWKEKESEPVEIIREIQWLVDKNSRINFELELLRADYKDFDYDPATQTLKLNMRGKMKTQDITFNFEVTLPNEYPMKVPEIRVLNKFELETQEKIKKELQNSFNDFFNEWTPFSYLVDLFNLISKKIFEVSIVSCVICHKIECPTCSMKIAGENACHVECPYCERSYHKHCWEQTIKSFGKCGFCLKTPPPSLIP